MWVEFVVGSRLCTRRFFSGFSDSVPLPTKTSTSCTVFGGAYLRRETWVSKSIGLALQLEVNLSFLLCFSLYLRAIFQVQAPRGLYLEGRFNGGFFALPVWGAYIWRGLIYMEGLIFGILRYALGLAHEKFDVWKAVASQSKFPCGPLDRNSWVDPN